MGCTRSAADLARFLRFQLNDGSIDGRMVLDPALMERDADGPAPHAGAPAGYALGVARTRWRAGDNADLFSHGGGGFGFLSDLWWVPQLQLGIAILTNSADHQLQADLALSMEVIRSYTFQDCLSASRSVVLSIVAATWLDSSGWVLK